MNFEQIDKSEETENDVFLRGPVIVGESFDEKHVEDDKDFIKENMDLIHRFDTARNQAEASMMYKEALQTEDRDLVKEVYDFVKVKKQER